MCRDGDVEVSDEEVESSRSRTGVSAATSSAYTLMDTAHPVFGRVKRLWNSPLESHREICAVLAAISEVSDLLFAGMALTARLGIRPDVFQGPYVAGGKGFSTELANQ